MTNMHRIPSRDWGRDIPTLGEAGLVVAQPMGPHALVLGTVARLSADSGGGGVFIERLAGSLSNPKKSSALTGAMVNPGFGFRRWHLYIVLGDLVDYGMVTTTLDGLVCTPLGLETARRLMVIPLHRLFLTGEM
jgi:hypothetical protein